MKVLAKVTQHFFIKPELIKAMDISNGLATVHFEVEEFGDIPKSITAPMDDITLFDGPFEDEEYDRDPVEEDEEEITVLHPQPPAFTPIEAIAILRDAGCQSVTMSPGLAIGEIDGCDIRLFIKTP